MKRDLSNLKRLIKEFGFEDIENELLQYSRPSIRAETIPVSDEVMIPLGQSKIGGRPDLPIGLDWSQMPPYKGKSPASLPFIAQFNLSEVKLHDVEDLLPSRGMLYFFGRLPLASDTKHGQVIFFDGQNSPLERRDFPDDLTVGYAPCSVTLTSEVNLDDLYSVNMDRAIDYDRLLFASSYQNLPFSKNVNRLLGITHDIPVDIQKDRSRLVEKNKNNWQLLFQMSSDPNADMMWWDSGEVCYYIRREDLQAGDFEDVCFKVFSS
ncbi:MAG: DUF1963 domain-containing protein [Anaerolineae bacterium]